MTQWPSAWLVTDAGTVREHLLDGNVVYALLCPGCNVETYLDDDQLHGRVSCLCDGCGWHETRDFASALDRLRAGA